MTSMKLTIYFLLLLFTGAFFWNGSASAQSSTYTLNVSSPTVAPGGIITVSWSAPSAHSSKDWIGIFLTTASNRVYVSWQYVPHGSAGRVSFVAPSGPSTYEFRYLLNDGFVQAAKSVPISVTTTDSPSPSQTSASPSAKHTLAAAPTTAAPGATITVSWSAPATHAAKDWVGIFQVGSSHQVYVAWQYVPKGKSGTLQFTAPNTLVGRTYEFRYFLNDGFIEAARSGPISVTQPSASPKPSLAPTTPPPSSPPPPVLPAPRPATPPPAPTSNPPSPIPGPCPQGKQIAFPGAEGFGQCAQGGRGGRIIEVTNLNDDGPGSLRECAQEASGPRTCVFRMGGTISLNGNIVVRNPYLTIAGQTAPGGGITLKDGHLSVRANHVIVRYIRIRPGDVPIFLRDQNANGVEVRSNEGMPINNVIVDHCSISWTTDDMLQAVFGSDLVTFQWNILAEGLYNDAHPYIDGKGTLIGYGAKRVSVHHNLYAQTVIRQPEVTQGDVDVVNNYSYDNTGQDMDLYAMHGPIHENIVGNYFQPGPTSNLPTHRSIRVSTNTQQHGPQSSFYLFGNIGPARPDDTLPQTAILNQNDGPTPLVGSRHDYPLVTTTDAITAKQAVLAGAGARVPMLDAVDQRVLTNVQNGTASTPPGKAVRTAQEVGGWPVLPAGTPPTDTDHDGMSDAWEVSYGLDPTSPSDATQDADGDGYTNVEEYFNGSNPKGSS